MGVVVADGNIERANVRDCTMLAMHMTRKAKFMTDSIKRGEVYFCDLDPVLGSEQGGKRPVLVISNNTGNKYSPTVIVAAITSQTKTKLPTHLPLSGVLGLHKTSVVLLEQLRTIDKSRLKRRVTSLGLVAMRLVDARLTLSIGVEHVSSEIMVMSLCHICVQSFSDSEGYRITRADPNQIFMESCMICNIRNGFDYKVVRR